MLGLNRRRDRRWEWEMLFPNPGFFPQMSHTDAMTAAKGITPDSRVGDFGKRRRLRANR